MSRAESSRRPIAALAVSMVTIGCSILQAPAASAAANATIRCGTLSGATSTNVALTVGQTYTIENLPGTFGANCSVAVTAGTTGTISWTSSDVLDVPSTDPSTLRMNATMTVTMVAVGTQTLWFSGNSSDSFVFTVSQAPETFPNFTASSPPSSAAVGSPYAGYTFSASGGGMAYAVATGALPPGLTLASNGSLSGTPTTAGSYTFTVSATNSQGTATTSSITITVSGGGGNATAPASGPAPWLQSYGRVQSDACRAGWHASWAEWAVDKSGGWVCNRTVFWNGSSWAQNANEVWGPSNPADSAAWDGN